MSRRAWPGHAPLFGVRCVLGLACAACTPHATLGDDRSEASVSLVQDASVGDGGPFAVVDSAAVGAGTLPHGCEGTDAPAMAARCTLDGGGQLPEELTANGFSALTYYAGGAALPPGRYRVAYVDGCVALGALGVVAGWTVHASSGDFVSGAAAFWLVASDGSLVVMPPGTVGVFTGTGGELDGAYQSYAQCVSANCALPAVDFDFAGGSLAIHYGAAFPTLRGETAGGRSPTFRLSRLDACP